MSVTPHHDVHPGARPMPDRLSDGVRDEFRALTLTCGLFDLSSRVKLQLTGKDRVRWLNGMVTNKVRDLALGQGVYAFLLNPQGHILGDLYAFNLGERILVDTDASQRDKVLGTFDHYIIMDDVEVADVSDTLSVIGIAGPAASPTLASAGFDLPPLRPLQIVELSWRGHAVSIVRGDKEGYPSFQCWIAPAAAQQLREALVAAGASSVGQNALELYRISLGIPRYGQDIRERDLPQETEQAHALNFNKGCYIGQEIVERIRSRGSVHRSFTGFLVNGPPPSPGTKIQSQTKDKEVGEVTSSAVIPTSGGEQTIALGYIRKEAASAGNEVQIAESTAIVTPPPFADLLRQGQEKH
jgi:folate-binding protein YgfZ